MKRTKIKALLETAPQGQRVRVMGWVRTFRNQQFVSLHDGSTLDTIQLVVEASKLDKETLKSMTTGACLAAEGRLIKSLGKGQKVEIEVQKVTVLGASDAEKYPLQPKRHSLAFLREIAHLRARTNTFGAVMRMRHAMAFSTHQFFNDRGFFYIHTPIVTASDAEGAGALFRVTTLDIDQPPRNPQGAVDYKKDFFGKETYLTVSGQLEVETHALALGDTYTFGPTFRAENSNTSRHLAEFWMIEPEMAFYDLDDAIVLAQDFLRHLARYALTHCEADLAFLDKRAREEEMRKPARQRSAMTLIERLRFVADNDFTRMSYTEAVEILKNSKPNKKGKFEYPVKGWGVDLQSEHECFLVERYAQKPVVIYDYPADAKAFYMRQNDDGKTVAAMDVLFPGIGEIAGGSQREERYSRLLNRIRAMKLPEKELDWYLDLRRFGSAPHSGFGVGFERLMMFVTGMNNIRDVIPFPRFPGHAAC